MTSSASAFPIGCARRRKVFESLGGRRERAGAGASEAGTDRSGRGAQSGGNARVGRETEEIARSLDRLADRLAREGEAGDPESRRLADRLARIDELRERIESLTRQAEALNDKADGAARPGATGKAEGGTAAGRTRAATIPRACASDYARQLQQTRALLDALQRRASCPAAAAASRSRARA